MKTKELYEKEGLTFGDIHLIATLVGCTAQYICKIIEGKRGNKGRDSIKAFKIHQAMATRRAENEALAKAITSYEVKINPSRV